MAVDNTKLIGEMSAAAERYETEAKFLSDSAQALRKAIELLKGPGENGTSTKPTYRPPGKPDRPKYEGNQLEETIKFTLDALRKKGGPVCMDDVFREVPETLRTFINRQVIATYLAAEAKSKTPRIVRVARGFYAKSDGQSIGSPVPVKDQKAALRGRALGMLRNGMGVMDVKATIDNEFPDIENKERATIVADAALQVHVDLPLEFNNG